MLGRLLLWDALSQSTIDYDLVKHPLPHPALGTDPLMSNDSNVDGTDADSQWQEASIRARRQNMRLGLTLFFVYLVLYTAFVVTSAFFPDAMELRPFGGINLALLWGFGLIGVAILLAFIYGMFSRVASAGDGR